MNMHENFDLMETPYDLEYRAVKCVGVYWDAKPYVFHFRHLGYEFYFRQTREISQSADTDHIRCAIDQFFEEFEKLKLPILSSLLCWLDLPCIVPLTHLICDACLLNGIKAEDDLLPRICEEVNAVSRKLEGIK